MFKQLFDAGYYGYSCGFECPQACENGRCDKSDGWCMCIDGYYMYSDYYRSRLYYYCDTCPRECVTCASSSKCTRCTVGYFGSVCDQQCRNCRNNTCSVIDGQCTDGCKDGHFEESTGCKQCPDNCSVCRSRAECDECAPGFYGSTCQRICPRKCYTCENGTNCQQCKIGYYGQSCEKECSLLCNNGCSKEDGECGGCIGNYYKQDGQCKRCSNGCSRCDSKDECIKCQNGFFLDQTKHHCNECGLNCSTCYGRDSCTTCNEGYANVVGNCLSCQNCNDSKACLSKYVCSKCLYGFWGSHCVDECNDTCIRCEKSTGECIDCKDNTFGQYCEQKCSSHCLQSPDTISTCWPNGTCIDGCVNGFTGADCIGESSSTSSPQVAKMVGSISGVVALFLIVVIVVILMYRRRFKQQYTKVKKGEPKGSREPRVANAVLNLAYDDTDNEPKTVREHQNAHSDVSSGHANHVYTVLQEESLRNPAKPNKAHEHDVKNFETDNVYDVFSSGNGLGMQADRKITQAEGDTYSHIRHASRARQLCQDDEDAYDHVTRHNLQKSDDNDTYDVTSGLHGYDFHV